MLVVYLTFRPFYNIMFTWGERMKKTFPFLFKVSCLILLISTSFYFFLSNSLNNKGNKMITKSFIYNSIPNNIEYKALDVFYGQLTGYGPDCKGCIGITKSGYDVRNGNIYFNDKQYGKVRIIAADKKYKLGTIIKITAPKLYDYSFIAIVLDRGGKITGNNIDLLFEKEEGINRFVGRQKKVKFEVLRYGW